MKIMTATKAKMNLSEVLSLGPSESVLIEKNGKEAVMAFPADIAKKMVLTSYSNGGISRVEAMSLLGLGWYGELLDALDLQEIPKPLASEESRALMTQNFCNLLSEAFRP